MAESLLPGVPSKPLSNTARPVWRTFLRRALLVAAPLLLWQGQARATHAMGGELSYECLGNGQYRIILNFYRDCNGVAAPTNCNNGRSFNIQSASCGVGFDACFGNPTVEVITPICPSESDRCLNAGGTYGVEKYTYTKVVDLSPYLGCNGGNDWIISWSLCCRNNAITSLNDPGNRHLYLNARWTIHRASATLRPPSPIPPRRTTAWASPSATTPVPWTPTVIPWPSP
jgi:hypothetical protein